MLVLAGILFCLLSVRATLPYLIKSPEIIISEDDWGRYVSYLDTAKREYEKQEPREKREKRKPYWTNQQWEKREYTSKEYKKEVRPNRVLQMNLTDSVELIGLKGIGAYTASKVLRYRDQLGGFYSSDQFSEIKGLRPEQLDTLAKYALIDPGQIRRIALNTDDEKDLFMHPYIRHKAKVLVRYRKQHGHYTKPEDLLATGVVDETLLEKLKPYLGFD